MTQNAFARIAVASSLETVIFGLTGTSLRHESLVHHHPWHLDYPTPILTGCTVAVVHSDPHPLVPCLAKPRRMEPKLEILTNEQLPIGRLGDCIQG